jgi:putative phosphoesterase
MALVGLISDSHGEWLRTQEAISLLSIQGCDCILHMGDIETHEVLDALAGNNVSLVFGNCDVVSRLDSYAMSLGLDVQHPAGTVEVEGKQIAFLHGHDEKKYLEFLENPSIDVIVHGHTHEKRDEVVNNTRCINPGALHRAQVYTVAVLDTSSDSLTFHELN